MQAESDLLTYLLLAGLGASAGRSKDARRDAHSWIQSALQVGNYVARPLIATEMLESSRDIGTSTLPGYTVSKA